MPPYNPHSRELYSTVAFCRSETAREKERKGRRGTVAAYRRSLASARSLAAPSITARQPARRKTANFYCWLCPAIRQAIRAPANGIWDDLHSVCRVPRRRLFSKRRNRTPRIEMSPCDCPHCIVIVIIMMMMGSREWEEEERDQRGGN